MKIILFVVCSVAFFQNFVHGRFFHNRDGIVGVSQKTLEDHILKAFKGFKEIMLHGCEELDYPVMDPYELKSVSWDYVDASGNKKFNFFNTNSSIVRGLSNFDVKFLSVNAKDMGLSFRLQFSELKMELPYKLDGYLYKNFLPVYGEGLVKLSTDAQYLNVLINLGTDRGYITVENVLMNRFLSNINIKITGFMDLNEKLGSEIMDDILDPVIKQYDDVTIEKFVRNLIEEAVGGMTTEEFFDLLDHFVEKNNQR